MEEEIPPANRIDQIYTELEGLKDTRLKVRANLGRSRTIERTGILVGTYDALFIIEVEERRGRKSRQSYQYVDVLTSTVEIYDPDTGERLLDFSEEE